MKPTPEQIRALARATLATRPSELTCDEWLERVAVYVERVAAGEPIPPDLAEVEEHAVLCPECAEELRALLEVIRGDSGSPG